MRSESEEKQLARLETFSRILDIAFRVPGTNIRFGADALLGLIPGVGDTLGAALSSYIIFEAARIGAPVRTLLRMIGNVVVEWIVGTIPIAGDLFDVAWKANVKNFALLRDHVTAGASQPRSSKQAMRLFLWGAALVIIGLLALAVMMAAYLYQLLLNC